MTGGQKERKGVGGTLLSQNPSCFSWRLREQETPLLLSANTRGLERDPSGQSLGQAGRQRGGAPELNLK